MKNMLYTSVLLLLISCQSAPDNTGTAESELASALQTNASFVSKYPLLSLLRKNPAEIGCLLESELHYRDSIFNCSHGDYINKGDPCKNTDAYYEGIYIPDSIAKKIHPAIKEMSLAFEHGSLQEISITFQDSLLKTEITKIYNLPTQNLLPENVTSIDYGGNIESKEKPNNAAYTRWLTLTGFEHIGAGELECE